MIPEHEENDLPQQELLTIMIELYSLPKYVDQIKGTAFGTPERIQKITELNNKIKHLYKKLDKNPPEIHKDLTASQYFKQQMVLRHKLVHNLLSLYPKIPSFIVVDHLHKKLGNKYEKQFEDLLRDIVEWKKQQQIKENATNILLKKFQMYDVDGTGTIQISQLEKAIEKFQLPKIVVKGIMNSADTSKDGKISLSEFKKYAQDQILKYYKIFYNLDSDNDQRLNYKQTKHSLHEIYPDIEIDRVFNNIFKTMDQDKTGLITFQEWCQFLLIFPRDNLNYMINQWRLIASTIASPQQSSAFIDNDLLKGMKVKHGKLILSWYDIIRTLIFGGIAGAISRTITAPLQRLKILYQTMYTQSKVPSISVGLRETYAKHGFVSLFKGNSISVSLNCLEQALRFTIIEYQKKTYELRGDKIQPLEFLFIGVITGILSTFILFPLQVLRVRFITSRSIGSIFDKVKDIHQNSGFRGFYSGLTPHLMSVLPSGSFNVMSYNLLRRFFINEKDAQHPSIYKFMMIGGFASLITNTVTYPMSLITSRLIVANKSIIQFKSKIKTFQMIKRIYEHEGFRGFYKGYNASTLRIFIGQSFNFGTYESLKMLWQKKDVFYSKDH